MGVRVKRERTSGGGTGAHHCSLSLSQTRGSANSINHLRYDTALKGIEGKTQIINVAAQQVFGVYIFHKI